MTKLLLLLVTFVALFTSANSACAKDWKEFNGECYKAIPPVDDAMTFEIAQAECQKVKAELTSIHSNEENEFLNGLIKGFQKEHKSYYWIGMSLSRKGGKLEGAKWLDGTPFDFSNPTKQASGAKPWGKTEPNNWQNEDENCVAMYGYDYWITFNGEWNDLPCNQSKAKYMEAQGGALCKLKSGKPYQPPATTPGKVEGGKSEPTTPSKPAASTTPKAAATTTPKSAATTTPKSAATTTPKSAATTTPKPASSTTPKPSEGLAPKSAGACPKEYTENKGQCYRIVVPTDGLTFDQAEAECKKDGAHLASVHSEEENKFIIDLVTKAVGKKEHLFFIGLKTPSGVAWLNDKFSWVDGSPVDYGNPKDEAIIGEYPWSSANPSFTDEKENCVQLVGYNDIFSEWAEAGKWNDSPCDSPVFEGKKSGAICKRSR